MAALFPTTRRSVLDALGSGDENERARALDTLTSCYWKPLYKLARVIWSHSREDAEDLTQSFFARAIERETLAAYDARKASFRAYLRLLFERHAANEWKAAQRLKRGGSDLHLDLDDAEAEISGDAAHGATPEEYFQREWVRSVFDLAVTRLRERCEAEGRQLQFALFEAYALEDDAAISYRELAGRFGIAETRVTNQLHAARRRFREIVLETLREITASDREFRDEARALLGVNP